MCNNSRKKKLVMVIAVTETKAGERLIVDFLKDQPE